MLTSPTAQSIELWSIERLREYPRNPRKNDAAVDRMCASIREFGFKIPCLVRSDGELVDGHLRLKSARKLGITEIPVILCAGWTDAQVKAFRLMVNRSVTWAEWDEDLLGLELLDLRNLDFDLGLTGFDEQELARLLAAQEPISGLCDDDEAPAAPQTPTSRTGEIWKLGSHRLLVGDATRAADVERLMAGEKADAVFIDSPYNTNYEGYTKDKLTIQNDHMSSQQFEVFLESLFRSCRSAVKAGASLYACHGSSFQREFQNAIERAGFEVRCQIIWAKNTFAWGFGRYKFQHEPIFYCHVAGQSDAWYGDKSQSTLWEVNKPAANRLHPTMKPVELIERALINSTKDGDLVADFCAGAGSTLIACEKRTRAARLIEIDPRYADVIVQRFIDFSGKKAVLDGDGRTFEEIAKERRQETS